MSSRVKKLSTQNASFLISCLVSVITFVFIVIFAIGLSSVGNTATFESLFSYCKDTQTLTLFGQNFPLSDLTLKLFSIPSASVEFTLKIFPPLIREFICKFADVFCKSFADFVSFIIQFTVR